MNPYFSVCIPSTNRGKTIFKTLCSVANQSFRDFELIIVDCGSTDNTRNEIERFFNSSVFNNSRFVYKYETRDYVPKTVEDWNEPLRLARGKYIAMLEGDDQYLPNHLLDAYDYLYSHDGIGLYAVGNQVHSRTQKGFHYSKEWFEMTLLIQDITPPSESIFVRLDKLCKPYYYNDTDYEYAPEMDLYARLALAGYNVFFSGNSSVVRNISHKNRFNNLWHYYVDRFTLLYKYRQKMNNDMFKQSLYIQAEDVIFTSLMSKSLNIMKLMAHEVINQTSLYVYCRSLFLVVVRSILKIIHI